MLSELLSLYRELSDAVLRDRDLKEPDSDDNTRAAILREILARQPEEKSLQRLAMVSVIRQMIVDQCCAIDMLQVDRTLLVMNEVAREEFLPADAREFAYLPTPIKIGYKQTLSHPHVVAMIIAAADLALESSVLDVGTGSGYQAAILSRLAKSVTSVEIIEPLAEQAAHRLHRLGFANVEVRVGDGAEGAPDRAPFDAIVVAAGASAMPPILFDQLKIGGRLIMPIGLTTGEENLIIATKGQNNEMLLCSLGPVQFVPLTGRSGRPLGESGTDGPQTRL